MSRTNWTCEIAVEVEPDTYRVILASDVSYTAGSRDYFDRNQECMYPGDPEEFLVEGFRWKDTGAKLTDSEIEEWRETVEDKAYELFIEERLAV